jgi:hypothetical protein
VLDETVGHIAAAEKAIAALPESDVTKVLKTLGEFLVDRVDAARGS